MNDNDKNDDDDNDAESSGSERRMRGNNANVGFVGANQGSPYFLCNTGGCAMQELSRRIFIALLVAPPHSSRISPIKGKHRALFGYLAAKQKIRGIDVDHWGCDSMIMSNKSCGRRPHLIELCNSRLT